MMSHMHITSRDFTEALQRLYMLSLIQLHIKPL